MWCRFYDSIYQYEKKNRPNDKDMEYDVYVDKWMRDQEQAKKMQEARSKMDSLKGHKGMKLGG